MTRRIPVFVCGLAMVFAAVSADARPHYTSLDRGVSINWGGAISRGEIKVSGLPAPQTMTKSDLISRPARKAKPPRDAASGLSTGKRGRDHSSGLPTGKRQHGRAVSPRDAASGRATGKRGRDAASGLSTGKRQHSRAGGLPTGKRRHRPIRVRKRVDAATPLIRMAFEQKRRLPRVVIRGHDTSGTVRTFELISVMPVSYSGPAVDSGKSELAMEEITLSVEEIRMR